MEQQIDKLIKENPVVLFSKSKCPYCKNMKDFFKRKNISYQLVELDKEENEPFQEILIKKTKHQTVPQIFVNGKFIGGTEETHNLFMNQANP